MKKILLIGALFFTSGLVFQLAGSCSSGGCFGVFSCQANDASDQFDICRDSCNGWTVVSPYRCRRGCDAQYGGALNDAANMLDWCLAHE